MEVFLSQKELDTVKRAIDIYGVKNQEDVAIEEMSELTKAIIKNRRYNTDETRANIREEIADVQIMLMQLFFCYGVPSNLYSEKIDRLEKRLDETNEPQKTNFDLMKNMTLEELAEFLIESHYSESEFIIHSLKNIMPEELIENLKQDEIKAAKKFLEKVVENA